MKYDAFISYRHTEPDMEIAKAVHKGLETFRIPRAVRKSSGKKRINRVFRDQEELPIGSDLTDNIDHALDESKYLIVICSPNTPGSEWVAKEIDYFLAHHPRERALAVLVDGEPSDSFPQALLTDAAGNPVEPLAADVRGAKRSERKKKLKIELMRLAAPLLNCSYDDLRQRHRERKMRRLAAGISLVAVAGVAFGLYSNYNARQIAENYRAKLENQSKYFVSTANTLLENGDRRAAALVAAKALPTEENDRPFVPSAVNALSSALHVYDTGSWFSFDRILKHEMPVNDFKYNRDATLLTSIDQGNSVYVWNTENGERILKINAGFDEKGNYIYIKYANIIGDYLIIISNKSISQYDMSGNCIRQEAFDAEVSYASVNQDETLAVCTNSECLYLYSIENGQIALEQTFSPLDENSFSGSSAFSDDNRYLAVSSHVSENEGKVTVFDLKSETSKQISVRNNFISDIVFTHDSGLVIASMNSQYLYDISDKNLQEGLVSLFDTSGNILWETVIPAGKTFSLDSSFDLCTHHYDDGDNVHDAVIACMDNTAYSFNPENGVSFNSISVSGCIEKIQPLTTSTLALIGEEKGDITIADIYTGTTYPDRTIQTNTMLRSFHLSNGILTGQAYMSPELYVMKYLASPNMETFAETAYSSSTKMEFSDASTYLADFYSDDKLKEHFAFYDVASQKSLDTYAPELEGSLLCSGFIDESRYAVIDSSSNIFIYDISVKKGGKANIPDAPELIGYASYGGKILPNALAFTYDKEKILVYDLANFQMKYITSATETVKYAAVSPDGKFAAAYTAEGKLYYVDLEQADWQEITNEISMDIYLNENALTISDDGAQIAAACIDGLVHVYDSRTHEKTAEIPYTCRSRGFLAFSPDGKDLLMQGDDYYFKVFNLEKNEFVFLADEQYNTIRSHAFYENNIAALITTSSVILMDTKTYEPLAIVMNGRAYDASSKKIYAKTYHEIVSFPYLDHKQLLEELNNSFPDEELSFEERMKYHID